MNDIFLTVKKILEKDTYYLLDLKGCTRNEYKILKDKDKEKIDYLSDDYDEEFFKEDENGKRTIPDPNHLVIPSNMHTIKGQGVSVEKAHRIVNVDGSIINAFEIIMKLCEKYKEINPNSPFPLIRNKYGFGYNWLEGFYKQYSQFMEKSGIEDCMGDTNSRFINMQNATKRIRESMQVETQYIDTNDQSIGE